MAKFDFPRVKQKDIVTGEEPPDEVLRKMIERAKVAVTKDAQEIKKRNEKELFQFESDEDEKKKRVESPSLLIMCCNLVEALRLREEIIHRVH